jgi:hypothetical protein
MCLTIEAEHLGLRVHQMAGWDEQKVKQALGYPPNFRVVVMFALGLEADVRSMWEGLDEKTRNKIAKPRERKPLAENFFSGRYGKRMFETAAS